MLLIRTLVPCTAQVRVALPFNNIGSPCLVLSLKLH